MSDAPPFETLIYTDCRPGQGLSGNAGMQFQARSDAATEEAARLVQRALLYEPPEAWMRLRRPAPDYPLMFGHHCDGHLATARGRYLGQEANGGRQGNHVTHALVTADPASYRGIRPAQLFGAAFWVDGPAPTTRCERVRLASDLGGFEPDQLRDFVEAQQTGPAWLAALVATLLRIDQRGEHRVIFVSPEPEPVLRWLAAATLLVPQRQALAIGFKVYATNPAQASTPVVAVHPEWADAVPRTDDPGQGAGLVVFDLTSGKHSPVAVAPVVSRWVSLFRGADPYDVVEMVELASATGLVPETALAVATTAVLGSPPRPADVDALLAWLTDGPDEIVRVYGEKVARAVAAADRSLVTLRALDALAAAGRLPGGAAAVRLALLRAEIAYVSDPLEEILPEIGTAEWTREEIGQAIALLRTAADRTEARRIEPLLRLCRRHRLPLSDPDLATAVDRFVVDWADHPERNHRVDLWPVAGAVPALLRAELARRLRDGTDHAVTLGAAWWRTLLNPAADPSKPLEAALLAAAMVDGDRPRTEHILAEQLGRSHASTDPAATFTAAARVLWSLRSVSTDELRAVLTAAPAGSLLPAASLEPLLAHLRADPVPGWSLEMYRKLTARGLVRVPELDPLLQADVFLADLCLALPGADRGAIAELARQVARVDRRVLPHHADVLFDAVVRVPPQEATVLLRELPMALQRRVAEHVRAGLCTSGSPRQAAIAFLYWTSPASTPTIRSTLGPGLDRWRAAAGRHALREAGEALVVLGPEQVASWDAWLANRSRRRR